MRKCIYTAIFGDYDTLKDPLIIEDGYEYICFSDKEIDSKIWKIKKYKLTGTVIMEARRVKILGLEYLMDYDYLVWVDASLRIKGRLSEFYSTKKTPIFFKHPHHNSLKEELDKCILKKKANAKRLTDQYDRYIHGGYPDDQGMIQTGVMFRYNTRSIRIMMRKWFREVENETHRDQMSWNYLTWLYGWKYGIYDSSYFWANFEWGTHKK